MNTYITKVDVDKFDRKEAKKYFGGKVGKGRAFSSIVILKTERTIDEIYNFPGVLSVEQDVLVEADLGDTTIVSNPDGTPGQSIRQNNAGWALRSLSRPYDDNYYFNRGGGDVDIYVVDSGVNGSLSEFSGRVQYLYSSDSLNYNGLHGTAVASCAAGIRCGTAKNANIFSLRIGDSPYSYSNIVEALDTVAWHHWAKTSGNPSVVCMSYGRPYFSGDTHSVFTNYLWMHHEMKNSGIVMVSSSGNNNLEYYGYKEALARSEDIQMPAGSDDVISVGAHDSSGNRSVWSGTNSASCYGANVDLWAPGTSVQCYTQTGALAYHNGTSLACPLVVGAIATLLEGSSKPTTGTQVEQIKASLLANLCAGDFNAATAPNSTNKRLKTYNYPFWAAFTPMFP